MLGEVLVVTGDIVITAVGALRVLSLEEEGWGEGDKNRWNLWDSNVQQC
jgi:hypothetical protein